MSDALERLQQLLDEAEQEESSPNPIPPRELDPRLHGYQRKSVQHLHQNPRSVLMLDMGMGKTATCLQALTSEHLPALVIAPKRVAENVWPTESEIWRPEISVALAAGSPKKRAEALESRADLVIIGRDNIKDVNPGVFRTIILDELSSFKSRQSKRWHLARKICKPASYVWGLTGTPAPNSLLDLWPQMFLIDQGSRLETTLTKYRERYFRVGHRLPNGVVTEYILREGSEDVIHQKISDICLSMDSEDHLDLPSTRINDIRVPLDARTTKVYESMRSDLVASIDESHVVAANAAVATGKLSQIVAGFLYPDPDDPEASDTTHLHSNRIDAVVEVVEGTGSPVLVFYRFVEERDRILKALPQARTLEDQGMVEEWNRGNVPVLLVHPASSGHGLNLQKGGHTIVWSTLPWSLEEYLQANARLARQGQKRSVTIHRLISPGTVDEAIVSSLEGKQSRQDALRSALSL